MNLEIGKEGNTGTNCDPSMHYLPINQMDYQLL